MRPRRITAVFLAMCIGTFSLRAGAAEPTGAWLGTYRCLQGLTAGDLVVTRNASGGLDAVFHFFADPSNPGVPEGCFTLTGTADAQGTHISLRPREWIVHPPMFLMAGIDGDLDPLGTSIDGRITGVGAACSEIHLRFTSVLPTAPSRCRLRP